ncbi:MAG TPA: ATP synthase F1 subunit delta [Bacteroidales bacterium]|jgi:F-type H+-transporting ATPase subunit delta
MNNSKISFRYAKALFDLAIEFKVLDKVNEDMLSMASVCRSNRDFTVMLKSPVIHVDKKHKIMGLVFGASFTKLSITFLNIITLKRRESYLPAIATQFTELFKEHNGITTVNIQSAFPMDGVNRKKLTGLLEKMTNREIELVEEVKAELLGGFVITVNDVQYDISIANRIQQLRKEFDKNLYIKGF